VKAALLAVGKTAPTLEHTPDTPTIYRWDGCIGPVSLTVDSPALERDSEGVQSCCYRMAHRAEPV